MNTAKKSKSNAQMMFLDAEEEQENWRSCNSSLNWKKEQKKRI